MASSGRYKKIVVPIDGSGWSERAIPHAVDIARNNGAELILLHVFKPPSSEYLSDVALGGEPDQFKELREEVKQKLMAVRGQIRGENVEVRVQMLEGQRVAGLICDYINGEEDVDLVVMSSHGRTGLRRWLFGSVAHKVMQEVNLPVMIITPSDD